MPVGAYAGKGRYLAAGRAKGQWGIASLMTVMSLFHWPLSAVHCLVGGSRFCPHLVCGQNGSVCGLVPAGSVGGALLPAVVALGAGELAEDPPGGASLASGAVVGGFEALLALGHGVLLLLAGAAGGRPGSLGCAGVPRRVRGVS